MHCLHEDLVDTSAGLLCFCSSLYLCVLLLPMLVQNPMFNLDSQNARTDPYSSYVGYYQLVYCKVCGQLDGLARPENVGNHWEEGRSVITLKIS